MTEEQVKGLLQIARCSQADPTLPANRPCGKIVGIQQSATRDTFQIPEPWRGDIERAPLLFVSSNPGLNTSDDSPIGRMTDEEIVAYYTHKAFPACFPRNLNARGEPNRRPVAFWTGIRARAAELYEKPNTEIVPGRDFALTEVVHCKSQGERGVPEALQECMTRHSSTTTSLSGAAVVIVLGDMAARALQIPSIPAVREVHWSGSARLLVWLPHPNARKPRKFEGLYERDDLTLVRSRLRDHLFDKEGH